MTLTQGTLDGTGTVGNVTVADLAGNIVTAGNGGTGTLTMGNLTFNGAATVSLQLGSKQTVSTLATNGVGKTITVNASNVGNANWAAGATKLIGYTSYNGTNFSDFTVGTITSKTSNQTAFLINNTGSSEIDLQITGNTAGIINWGAAKTIAGNADVFNIGTAPIGLQLYVVPVKPLMA